MTTPFENSGALKAGSTAQDVIDWMQAPESGWSFATDPWKAVNHASTTAAQAKVNGNRSQARFWAGIGVALVAAADSPHVYVGQVLADIAGLA